jgi:hypothetical protein
MPDPWRRKRIETRHLPALKTLMKATWPIQIFCAREKWLVSRPTVCARQIQMAREGIGDGGISSSYEYGAIY